MRSRWPGWRNLPRRDRRAGGHPGGLCLPLVTSDRLPIHPGKALDLALRGAALEQRLDRNQQIRLQDVHSLPPTMVRGDSNVPPPRGPRSGASTLAQGGGIWGGHNWGSLGGRRGTEVGCGMDDAHREWHRNRLLLLQVYQITLRLRPAPTLTHVNGRNGDCDQEPEWRPTRSIDRSRPSSRSSSMHPRPRDDWPHPSRVRIPSANVRR